MADLCLLYCVRYLENDDSERCVFLLNDFDISTDFGNPASCSLDTNCDDGDGTPNQSGVCNSGKCQDEIYIKRPPTAAPTAAGMNLFSSMTRVKTYLLFLQILPAQHVHP